MKDRYNLCVSCGQDVDAFRGVQTMYCGNCGAPNRRWLFEFHAKNLLVLLDKLGIRVGAGRKRFIIYEDQV